MQNKKIFKIIVFIVVLLIPVIYSFFYLKSYWDPYGNLKDMKIAIVNLDNGVDGTNQGKELVKELINKDVMNFCEVSQNEATEGLQNEEYYATITIPSNFTECLNSAAGENKQVATITYTPNQQKNYLASQIINKVVTATEMSLESKVGQEVVSTLSETLSDVPESLEKISDGANEIYDGTSALNNGLQELNSGIGLLNSKYTEFNSGVESAYQGSSSLNNGVSQVNSGIDSLAEGATTLDDAIAEINTGVSSITSTSGSKISELVTGINQLDEGATNLNTGIQNYVKGVDSLSNGVTAYTALTSSEINLIKEMATYSGEDEEMQKLAEKAKVIVGTYNAYSEKGINETTLSAGASQLLENGNSIKSGVAAVNSGTNQLKDSTEQISSLMESIGTLSSALNQVKDGTSSLKNGVSQLKTGTTQVQNGTESLEKGLQTLSSSSETVKESLVKLENGSKSAVDGSAELLNGVDTFKTEINNGLEESKTELTKLDGLSDYVSDPVVIEEEPYGEVSSYGIAFTPLFLSIGLWVGALMCYVVLYYDQKHRFGKLDYSAKNKILQNLLYIGIGIADGIITGFILKVGLRYDVANMGIYLLECGIVGAVFMTIIQFLIRNFGDIGKFLALIVLVLQLAAAGGTFPVETIDSGFRFLNPLLPMTYSIKIFKECLIETSTNFIGKNTLVLIGIAVVLGIITLGVETVKVKRKKRIL